MATRAELKQKTKEQLKGNYWILFGIMLLASVIMGAGFFLLLVFVVASAISAGVGAAESAMSLSIVMMVIFAALFIGSIGFGMGITKIYIGLTKGERPAVGTLFAGFKRFGKTLWLMIIQGFFTWAWSLLFIIPGIIKAFSYSQSMYILAENPDITALEALNRSKKMMHGKKMELFVLGLSFLGWIILPMIAIISMVTTAQLTPNGAEPVASLAFIAFAAEIFIYFFVIPYMMATATNFYHDIKGMEE